MADGALAIPDGKTTDARYRQCYRRPASCPLPTTATGNAHAHLSRHLAGPDPVGKKAAVTCWDSVWLAFLHHALIRETIVLGLDRQKLDDKRGLVFITGLSL